MEVTGTPDFNDLDGWVNTFGNIVHIEKVHFLILWHTVADLVLSQQTAEKMSWHLIDAYKLNTVLNSGLCWLACLTTRWRHSSMGDEYQLIHMQSERNLTNIDVDMICRKHLNTSVVCRNIECQHVIVTTGLFDLCLCRWQESNTLCFWSGPSAVSDTCRWQTLAVGAVCVWMWSGCRLHIYKNTIKRGQDFNHGCLWSGAGHSCADGHLDVRLEWRGSYMDGFTGRENHAEFEVVRDD